MRKKLVHDRSPWKYEIYSWTRYQLCYRVGYKNKCTPDHQAKLFDTLLHILLLIFYRDHFFDSKERYRKKVNRKTLQWTREGMLLWRKTWCPLGLSKKKWFKTFRYFRWVLKSVSAIKVSGQQNYCKPNEKPTLNMFLKGYPLKAKTAPKNWNLSVHISWARLASFCHLGFISDPLIVSKFHNETHDPKGQENKIYTIVKGRETF